MATTAALLLSHGKCAHRGKRGHGSSPTIAAIVSWLREEPVGSGKPTAEAAPAGSARIKRSEEHTSELQSLMRISYAVFCLKKTTTNYTRLQRNISTDNTHTTMSNTQQYMT